MFHISGKFYKLFSVLLLVTYVQSGTGAPGEQANDKWKAFKVMEKARSGFFFYDTSVNFSKYSKVMVLPVIFDKIKISEETKAKYAKNWKALDKEGWKEAAGYFDAAADKSFSKSDIFTLEKTLSDDVIVVQSNMVSFTPHVENTEPSLGTVGHSINLKGLGAMRVHTVLLDSNNKRVLAVIQSMININTGSQTMEDNRVSRNLAWHKSFQAAVDSLRYDLEKLRREKLAGKQ